HRTASTATPPAPAPHSKRTPPHAHPPPAPSPGSGGYSSRHQQSGLSWGHDRVMGKVPSPEGQGLEYISDGLKGIGRRVSNEPGLATKIGASPARRAERN